MNIDAYLDLANEYQQKGKFDLAIENFIKAIELEPDNSKIHNELAITYFYKKDYDNALIYFEKALKINPNYAMAYNNIGIVYSAMKNYELAAENYKKAIELNSEYVSAYNNLGNVYNDLKNYESAIECFKKAIILKPNYADTYNNLGKTFHLLNDENKAIELFKKAIEFNPNKPEFHFNLGISSQIEKLYEQAVKSYIKSIELNPYYLETYLCLGKTFNSIKKYPESEECFNRALQLNPNRGETYYQIADSFYERRLYEKAESYYLKAIELNPEHHMAHLGLGGVYLMRGDFEKGWKCYEARFFRENFTKINETPVFSQPRWKGECLKDKTIYVYWEQGFGDNIMFFRYILALQDMAKKVIFRSRRPLNKLFEANNHKAEIIDFPLSGKNLEFDVHCPLLSLPLAFKTDFANILYPEGYLKADKDKVDSYKSQYFDNDKFKVGIFWHGQSKSIKLSNFYKLSKLSNVKLYSLQKGDGLEEMMSVPDDFNITDLGESFDDYSDTAAAIANLDLVIAVDTSVAHLSAAMGKQTWLLLCTKSEWRWLQERDDSPWYKSIRLFRNDDHDSWEKLFDKLCGELTLIQNRG